MESTKKIFGEDGIILKNDFDDGENEDQLPWHFVSTLLTSSSKL